jgi:hypothetical protein
MIETPISDPDVKYLAQAIERLMTRAAKPQSAARRLALEAGIRGIVKHMEQEHGITFTVSPGGSILSWQRGKAEEKKGE